MVRDIGQILTLLQQQSLQRGVPCATEWNPTTPDQSVGPQQPKTLDTERNKIHFMETRNSCSLPTVAESRAESRVDSSQTAKGLATQRSLDSASKYDYKKQQKTTYLALILFFFCFFLNFKTFRRE